MQVHVTKLFNLKMSWNNDRTREQQERLLETQTDGLASSLTDKVSRIKQITSQMHHSIEQEHVY